MTSQDDGAAVGRECRHEASRWESTARHGAGIVRSGFEQAHGPPAIRHGAIFGFRVQES